jgi:hypothetical protein
VVDDDEEFFAEDGLLHGRVMIPLHQRKKLRQIPFKVSCICVITHLPAT